MKKEHFFEKRAPKIPLPPYSIPFLSVLHQNKALYNFRKRGQRSILERNIGLEYALKSTMFCYLTVQKWKSALCNKHTQ